MIILSDYNLRILHGLYQEISISTHKSYYAVHDLDYVAEYANERIK